MTTTSSSTVSTFNVAQTFFIDPGSVKNAPTISLTGVGLFFKNKPSRTNNMSGITAPGVDVFLCLTTSNGTDEVPSTTQMVYGGHARLEYDSITSSNTVATNESVFNFDFPINVDTGQNYAIVVKYDGDEAYTLWKSVEGDLLVGTNTQTAGPAGKYIGKYFEFSYVSNQAANTSLNTSTAQDITGSWKPLNSTDLKFSVYCAKFIPDKYANTTSIDPITGNTITNVVALKSYLLYKDPYEFVVYNILNSNNASKIFGGETIYQNNVMRPESVAVVSGSTLVSSSNVNFTSIFGNDNTIDRYMVIYSGNYKNVRKIANVVSNNALNVDIPLTFSNATATFSKVVAGKVDIGSNIMAFGMSENAFAINFSSANSSLRFTNNVVESITIANGGTGYANSNYILVSGGGIGGAPAEVNAVANVTTNSTGGIVSYSLTNKGIGFLMTPTLSVKAANGAAANGTGANLTASIGATLMTEFSNAILANTTIINLPVNSTILGAVDLENPYGTSYYLKKHYLYYSVSDGITSLYISAAGIGYSNSDIVTFTGGGGSGASFSVRTDSAGKIVSTSVQAAGTGYVTVPNTVITTTAGTGANLTPTIGVFRNSINLGQSTANVNLLERASLSYANTPLILSRSYEVLQPNTTIITDTGISINTNISSIVEMVMTSNNVYVAADILSGEVDVFYEKFAINNDATNEHTGNGRAVSKHVSDVVSLQSNSSAEDLRIYIDAYRPINTNLMVYARVINSKDPSPFVSKDWTLLEYKDGANTYSSPLNESDLVQYTFGFKPYHGSSVKSNGTITTTSSSAVITGSNTTFNTTFASGDMVKIYSPLFPNNYMIDIVNTVSNATSLTINNLVVNNNVVGAGLLIDKIQYKNQAFNNSLNNNVVRYFDSNNAVYDGYSSFAVKIVFLSNNEFIVPKVANIRAVAVTA